MFRCSYLESVGHWPSPAELPTPPTTTPFVVTTSSQLKSDA